MSKRAEAADNDNEEVIKKRKTDEVEEEGATSISGEQNGADESHGQRRRGKRHKYAFLMSYCGGAYYGMQIQKEDHLPTIEKHLFDALLDLRLITAKERRKPGEFWYQRAARTDKGVSAVRQVCSMILPLRESSGEEEKCGADDELSSKSAIEAINARLPEDIRVIGIRRTTKTFDAKNACESRSYAYTLPTYAFSLKDEDATNFRIPEDRLAEVNEVLSSYKGTHNYYNFTCRRSPTDSSCHRYIMHCQCGKPFLRDDIEFLTVHLTGQSFMLHQIRKMIGLCIAIVRGYADKKIIERAWVPSRYDVPIAPSLGLVLEEVHYAYYNRKYAKTHQPLEWTDHQDTIKAFRERYIDSVIVETEKKESTVLKWLDTLEYHTFGTTNDKNSESVSTSVPNPDEELGGNVSD